MHEEIRAECVARMLEMTPTQFVRYLRQYRNSLPVLFRSHSDSTRFCLAPSALIETLYSGDIGRAADALGFFTLYRQDWENHLNERDEVAAPEEIFANSAKQGGSNPETDKIKATNETCIKVEAAIVEQGLHLDRKGKIGEKEFVSLVEVSMRAAGKGDLYQATAAKSFFKSSNKLAPFKRWRGEKK